MIKTAFALICAGMSVMLAGVAHLAADMSGPNMQCLAHQITPSEREHLTNTKSVAAVTCMGLSLGCAALAGLLIG
jgi:hypothetical protein